MAVPEVSVVIPTRNRWSLLETSLSGALAQEDVDLEVVVVDDCSTDGTADELAAIDDARLRVVRHPEHAGVAAARNTGVAAAWGEWVAFLDDDDLWSPRKLRSQLDCAAGSGASFAYAAAVIVDDRGVVRKLDPAPPTVGLLYELLVRNPIPGGCSNVVARTELVRRVGGFDPKLSVMADWDLWIRLAQAGRAAACPEPLVAYVRHRESMVLQGGHDVLEELDYLEAKHAAARRALGLELDRQHIYRYFARAHRRGHRRIPAARLYLRSARVNRSLGDLGRAVGVVFGAQVLTRSDSRRAAGRPPVPGPDWLALYRRDRSARPRPGAGSVWLPIAPLRHRATTPAVAGRGRPYGL